MNPRYALEEIRKHWRDRTWWRKRFLTHVVSRYYDVRGNDGRPVIQEDWDNLLILDACRADLFEEVFQTADLPGALSTRTSVDSCTPGFLEKNFGDDTFHDVVYVTANPYVGMLLDDDQFHAVDHVWKDGWDDEHNTVMPETMRERGLAAAERHPQKRLIVHFVQPHAPFVGDVQVDRREVFAIRNQALGEEGTRQLPTPFEQLETGDLTREEVWAAYRANLEVALPAVEGLLSDLNGRSAVTADHGNALGERASPFPIRVYGHPLGILTPALTEVPWLVVDEGSRRTITAEPPETDTEQVDDATEERLRMLGYAE